MRKLIWPLFIIFAIPSIFFIGRLLDNRSRFLEVKNISFFPNTVFLPTLENEISKEKNAIYSASLLFAWDEVKKEVGLPIIIDASFNDLKLLNDSASHLGVLKGNGFTTKIKREGANILAEASFSKSLSFKEKMISFKNSLTFDKENIASFGLKTFDKNIASIISVLSYQDNENFILKLETKDSKHEILLYKSSTTIFSNLGEVIGKMNDKIESSKNEINKENSWRYSFLESDQLIIPKFNFNIECNFKNIEGKFFNAKGMEFGIQTAYQNISFLFDEKGAEVKSYSFFEVKSVKPERKNPKNMRLDKPFLLVLKCVDSKNPYFAMWVGNTELMLKE
jgi:hypothetical protein